MSNMANEQLLEEAAFYIDYFTDTTIGRLLEADVQNMDLDALHHHLKDARQTAFNLEFNPELA